MLEMNLRLIRFSFKSSQYLKTHKRFYNSNFIKNDNKIETLKIRNIGILAHIDAGKTTTTERMLYYSGTINSMGEVHYGNTVTDWMEQERKRGITITSAAVSFNWNSGHQFNLIDTPGHIDFTMEVEQTLSVLDGAIVILDGSAGVEAQTLTVWRQADRYNIPRIVFVNKMDRSDSDLEMCLTSIETKLNIPTLCTQFPLKEQGKLVGIVDVITLEKIIWDQNSRGKSYMCTKLTETGDGKLWEKAYMLRMKLVDRISDSDDYLAETIIQSGSLENISTLLLVEAMKRVTIKQKAIPIMCGSAYKNIGIQPLMNSIMFYLPSPLERNHLYKCFDTNFCAKSFKVIHDDQRGPLVFLRIYSGYIKKGQKIYNIQQDKSEQVGKLLVAYADDFKEVDSLNNGNIAVVTGLKQTIIGDLVTSSASVASNAKKSLLKKFKNKTEDIESSVESMFGVGTRIPEPVFFCSIEPPSLTYASALEQALFELSREDPSLRVKVDAETGQTVLAGMGELHLEIIKERIRSEYKIDVYLGSLQIAYKETPLSSSKYTHIADHKIGNSKHHVLVTMSIEPISVNQKENEVLKLDKTQDSASNLANLFPKHLFAIKQGVDTALNHGPKLGCPIVGINATLHWFEISRGTSETIISAAVTQCIRKLLSEVGTSLLEPIMKVEVVTSSDYLSTVLADLSRRRSIIQNITTRSINKIVEALIPLSELLGYATTLRTITSGTATFTMEFEIYANMNQQDEIKAMQSIRGF